MDKNPFLKRLMKDQSKDVVHSSAYAKAQNTNSIGAASTQSFSARREIDSNRTVVRGYRDSKIVNDAFGSSGTKLQGYDSVHDASQRAAIRERFGGNREIGTSESTSKFGSSTTTNNGDTPAGHPANPPARRNPGISR